ncbi:MAG: tetratricopeptide repeat protein [Bryobacterales bacterium]|nr:tetratricopeptide repeat protein [Bryobacterales bacterium]
MLADLHARLGDTATARACLERALALAPTPAERHLLACRLALFP